MHDSKYNWKYYSEPEPHLNNRRLFCPRGKMVGGCSSHNGMVFVRGNQDDYKRWESFGLKSWTYNQILPYFKKIESWSGGENQYRGSLGLLPVNQSKNSNPLFNAFLNATSEAGYKINPDMNGKYQEGFGMFAEMMADTNQETLKRIFRTNIQHEEQHPRVPKSTPKNLKMQHDETPNLGFVQPPQSMKENHQSQTMGQNAQASQPLTVEKKVGRNDPCPCGSGKKYKKCCG